MLSTRDSPQTQGHIQTEIEGLEKRYFMQMEKAGVAIFISDKIDFEIKTVIRNKEGHYIMIKGSIQEEDKTVTNIYTPNTGAPQYIRQTRIDIKGEIDSNTITVDFNRRL